MATRRRIGVSAATTEAARRQLMQPVPCWEKVWVVPENTTVTSNFKVYKWVKTEKSQQFSDDEGESDEPLAPLPDEPEVIDGDEEMEQEDTVIAATTEATQPIEPIEGATTIDEIPPESKPPSPPQLSMTLQPSSGLGVGGTEDSLDASLKPLDVMDDVDDKKGDDNDMELDISGLGPDGLQLEESHNLSQLDPEDLLTGGPLIDDGTDPFAAEG